MLLYIYVQYMTVRGTVTFWRSRVTVKRSPLPVSLDQNIGMRDGPVTLWPLKNRSECVQVQAEDLRACVYLSCPIPTAMKSTKLKSPSTTIAGLEEMKTV